MSQTLNFSWTLYGSGWEVDYDATVTISVSRSYGSDIARITASGSMHTPIGNGDSNAKWIFQLKIGGSTYNKTISSGYHAEGRRDSFSYTFDVNVGPTGGTLTGKADFQSYDNNNGFGAWAGEKDWSQTYGTKGASTIASATNVTLDLNGTGSDQPTSTVTWTSYSSSFTYRLHASCNGMTYYRNYSPATSGTVTANFGFGSDWIDYITNGKSATCTFTLTTYSGGSSIGSTTKNITLYVPSSGISPTVAIATEKVSALQNTYFANKYCTLIDKLKVTLTETIFKWDQNKSGSPIASRSIVANGENFTASPATTTNPLSTSGANTISASVTDGRGNSGSNTASVDVYWYFYPTVSVKYRHGSNYYLDISGRIAYVGGDQTTKTLRLAVYKGSTLIVDNLNLDSYIASTPSGGTYDGYLEINGAYAIPDEYISDISIDTYEFRLTVSDTVSSATATAYSGIAVMTFGAGGTDVTVHKPMTIEGDLRITTTNGDFRFNTSAPYYMKGLEARLTSTDDLNDYTDIYYMSAWCDTVQNRPNIASARGRVVCHLYSQTYYEQTSDSQMLTYERAYISNAWTKWKCSTLYRTTATGVQFNGYGCWNTNVNQNNYRLISAYSQTSNGDYSAVFVPFVAWGTWWIIGYNWNSSQEYTPTLKNSNWGSHPITLEWLPTPSN